MDVNERAQTVSQELVAAFEARRSAKTQFGQGKRDQDSQDRAAREYVRRYGATTAHLIPRLNDRRNSPGVDALDGDIEDPQFLTSATRFNFPCLIDHQPSKSLLGKYGVDEQRDAIFHWPFSELQEAGLVTPLRFRGIRAGDFVFWDGTFYVIRDAHRSHYHGLTDRVIMVAGDATRYQHTVSLPNHESRDFPPCPVEPPQHAEGE